MKPGAEHDRSRVLTERSILAILNHADDFIGISLAGFALVCGLGQQILWNTPASARLYLDYLVAQLPDPLRLLLAQTERAVGDAVMNRPI